MARNTTHAVFLALTVAAGLLLPLSDWCAGDIEVLGTGDITGADLEPSDEPDRAPLPEVEVPGAPRRRDRAVPETATPHGPKDLLGTYPYDLFYGSRICDPLWPWCPGAWSAFGPPFWITGLPDDPQVLCLFDPLRQSGGSQPYFPENRSGRFDVILDTPTAARSRWEIEVSPEPDRPAFRSRLSAMLGGEEHVGQWFASGEMLMKASDFEGASEVFRRAVAAAPESPAAKLALALALGAAGQYESGAHILRRGLRAHADWNAIRIDLASILGGTERSRNVLERLEEGLQDDADNRDARLLLGFLHFASGDLASAAEALGDAAEREREDPLSASLLAEVNYRLGPRAEVEEPAAESDAGH